MDAYYDISFKHALSGEPGCADDKAPPPINGAPAAAGPSPPSPHDASTRQDGEHMQRQHAAQCDQVQQCPPVDQQLLGSVNSLQSHQPIGPCEPALVHLPQEPLTAVPPFKPEVAGGAAKNRGVHEKRKTVSRRKDGSEGKDCWGFRDGLPARLLKQCRVRPRPHSCLCCHHERLCTADAPAAVISASIALFVCCICGR